MVRMTENTEAKMPADRAGHCKPVSNLNSSFELVKDFSSHPSVGCTFKVSRRERWSAIAAFFGIGIASLISWNNILYLLPYVSNEFLEGWDAGNSLLGVFQVGNLSAQVALLFFGAIHEAWLHIGLVLGTVLCACFGPSVTYGSQSTRLIMFHLLCLLLGVGSGLQQGSGYSIAAVLPANQVGMLSAGQGVAAILANVIIGALAFSVLDVNYYADVASLMHAASALAVGIGIICMILVAYALRQPGAKEAMAHAQADKMDLPSHAKDVELSVKSPEHSTQAVPVEAAPAKAHVGTEIEEERDSKTGECSAQRPLKDVVVQAAVPLSCVFVNFFITLNLFPRVGPLQWYTANPPRNHLIWLFGVFPFGETIGKMICTIGDRPLWLSKMIKFRPRLLPWLTLGRFLLYLPFFLSKTIVNNDVFSAFWFQMILMAVLSVSHGWLATISFMYSFDAVPVMQDKRRVGPLCVLCLIFGLISGLYLALLYR